MSETRPETTEEQPQEAETHTSPDLLPQEPSQLTSLRMEVARLDGYRKGLLAFISIVGVLVAVAIALLSWVGISGSIQQAVEDAVKGSLEAQLGQVVNEMDSRLGQASDAIGRAENAAGRAEVAAGGALDAASTVQAAQATALALATEQSAAAGVGEWIVGFASPTSIDAALADASLGIRAGYSISIYKIGDFYVPAIGIFPTEDEAKTAGLAIKSAFASSTAFYNLSVSCPYRQYFESGFYGCFSSPPPTPTP
jgi:hypothetical protein